MNLRQRLASIYGVDAGGGTDSRRQAEPHPRSDPLEGIAHYLRGQWVGDEVPQILAVDRFYGDDHRHGPIQLGEARALEGQRLALLAGDETFADFDLEQTVFFDTETTGLAGGTGTYVFLAGAGFFDRDGFQIRQFFLPDFVSESTYLETLGEFLKGFRFLVSFNGKSYDLNLLEYRFVMKRVKTSFRSLGHLDLLYPSRLFWRSNLPDCSLQTLERRLLRFQRVDDIDSYLIPQLYFNFLRTGQFSRFRQIFEHNRTDLLSLVSLSLLLSRGLVEPDETPFVDPLSVARLFARRGRLTDAAQLLEGVTERSEAPALQREVLLTLARLQKKLGHPERAISSLSQILNGLNPPLAAFEEAAKILEHRLGDIPAALELVERALFLYPGSEGLSRRRHRLHCRIDGKRWY